MAVDACCIEALSIATWQEYERLAADYRFADGLYSCKNAQEFLLCHALFCGLTCSLIGFSLGKAAVPACCLEESGAAVFLSVSSPLSGSCFDFCGPSSVPAHGLHSGQKLLSCLLEGWLTNPRKSQVRKHRC